MDQEIILHIGANKTGSSAIQTFIRNNINILNDEGYFIPDRLLGTSQKITGEHVFALEEYFRKNDIDGLTQAVLKLSQHAASQNKKLLLSGENMSNPGRFQFFKKLAETARIKVIFYIRRQDEFLTSSWQQWHSKVEEDFHAWLILAVRNLGHWERLIKGWEEVAGAQSVLVRVFERESFPDGNIMQDFLNCLEINPKTLAANYAGGAVNPSFSDIITPLVTGNRTIFKDSNDNDFYKMVHELTGDLYVKRKRVSLLTPAQRDKVIAFYAEENQRICQQYLPGRPRLFSEVDHSKYDYLSESEMLREQLKFMTTMIFKMRK